jgi:hypothetical protein
MSLPTAEQHLRQPAVSPRHHLVRDVVGHLVEVLVRVDVVVRGERAREMGLLLRRVGPESVGPLAQVEVPPQARRALAARKVVRRDHAIPNLHRVARVVRGDAIPEGRYLADELVAEDAFPDQGVVEVVDVYLRPAHVGAPHLDQHRPRFRLRNVELLYLHLFRPNQGRDLPLHPKDLLGGFPCRESKSIHKAQISRHP